MTLWGRRVSAGSDFFDDLRDLMAQHCGTGTAVSIIEHDLRERWSGSRVCVTEQRNPTEMSRATCYRWKRRGLR